MGNLSEYDGEKCGDTEGGFERMALIKCENVSIGYEGQTVVRDLNFEIGQETIFVLSVRMVRVRVRW